MRNGLQACLGLAMFVILAGCTAGSAMGSFSEDDVSTRGVSDWKQRRWDMRRMGTGLHMLRLGKRDSETSLRLARDVPMLRLGRAPSPAPSSDDVSSPPGSVPLRVSDQLLAILKDIMEQQASRDDTRRQPPLPRYGRRSIGLNTRNLGSSSGSDKSSRMYTFDFAEDDPVYRPPPRGGRYKRALTGLQTPQGQQLQGVYFPSLVADAEPRQRSMALPRIGRYTQENLLDMRTKAVPHPRIGRVPTSGTGSRKSAAADSDPMADPRQE